LEKKNTTKQVWQKIARGERGVRLLPGDGFVCDSRQRTKIQEAGKTMDFVTAMEGEW